MRRKSALCALLALILLSWTVLSACSRSKESIYWLNSEPALEATALALAKRYEKLSGVQVRVVTAVSGAYEKTLNAEMNRFGAPEIYSVSAGTVETWRDEILDLTDTAFAKERAVTVFDLTDGEDRLLAVGWGDECFGIAVNPVLLAKADHSLDEIQDFDTLRRVCEDIHARTDILGFDAFASTNLGNDAWRVTDVLAGTVCALTAPEDDPDDSNAVGRRFRAIYELCLGNSPTDKARIADGAADPLDEFLRGKAVFLPSSSGEYAALSAAVPEVVMIPCYCGLEGEEDQGLLCHTGYAWAVNAGTAETEQKNALVFLKWMVSDPEAVAGLTEALGILPYRTAAESSNGFLRTAAGDVAAGRTGASMITGDRKDADRFRKNLSDALRQCVTEPGEESWQAVESVLVNGK